MLSCGAAWAYPKFIGLGYTSCITCHYSPTGGGALNDYGRALYAVEIAQKPFWEKKKSTDELGQESGFLGSKPLPYWIRPGIKYRRLVQQINPGSGTAKRDGDYWMQMDLNLNFFTSEEQTKGLITTLEYLHNPKAITPNRTLSHEGDLQHFALREYFWRQQIDDSRWISVGFMDKPFGIKHADHTAFNRTVLPLAQNDQVHGAMYSHYGKKTELHAMAYLGNLQRPGDQQQPGASAVFEFEPVEKIRYGVSGLYEKVENSDDIYGLSAHTKVGLLDHNAWMFEAGTKRQKEWTPFLFSQMSLLLTQGLYLEPSVQYSQSDLTAQGVRQMRSGMGLLYFPFQRLELRSQLLYYSTSQQNSIGSDTWIVQAQIHLSL